MLKSVCALLVASVLASGVANAAPNDPVVKVTGGKVQGYTDSNGVKIFKGIPYADTTAGENRWKAPQPVKNWKGVLECKEFGQIAVQNEPAPFDPWTPEYVDNNMTLSNGKIGEDCLRVNVWTQANAGEKRPVIVYIHGGANVSGSGGNDVYSGAEIAQKGVVYVSLNYRVGIFGFLAYKDSLGEEVTGNFALQDQIAALKWVKENISKFGGDPNNITLLGQSAGSIDIQSLIISPAAAGLFNRAAYLSFNGYQSRDEPTTTALNDAEAEATKAIGSYLISDLRNMSVQAIMDLKYNPHVAVIDGVVLERSVKDAYNSGHFNKVDTICGGVPGDPYLFNAAVNVGYFFAPVTSMNLSDFYSSVPDKRLGVMYSPRRNPLNAAKKINNDYLIASYFCAAKAKDMHDPDHNAYIYFFDHVIPDTPERMDLFGAFHTSDVNYWLNHFTTLYPRSFDETDIYVGNVMSDYLVNFATNGDPNGPGLPVWNSIRNSQPISFMHLGDEIQFEQMDENKSMFWLDYVAKH